MRKQKEDKEIEEWVEKEYKVDNDNLNKRIEENIKVNGKLIDESAVARMGLMRRLKQKLAEMRKSNLEK